VSSMTSVEQVKIPGGYKQTEVGVIPEDWDVAPLNEICSFGGGTTPPRAQHDRYFINGSNNWVKTTDLNNSLIGDSEEQITDIAISETGLKLHPIGTVLVAMYGGFNQIGRTGYITRPSAINQALVAVKPKPKKLESYYLLSQLNYNVGYWKGVASSSRKDPNITSNDVKNYLLAFPLVKEQTAIANALSDVDALIASLKKLIAKKSAIKTASMQQLLTGQKRLPPFDQQHTGYQKTELGEIPEDWEVQSLGRIFGFKNGLNKAKEFFGYGSPIVNYMDVYNYPGINSSDIRGLVDVTKEETSAYSVKNGDVFFTRTSETVDEIGITTVLLDDVINGVFSGFILRAREKVDALDLLFKKYCFSSYYIRKQIKSTSSYTTRALTNGTLLSNVKLAFPKGKEEQAAIAKVLSDMDAEIDALELRLDKTQQIKQGMMQELLTGKTRLI